MKIYQMGFKPTKAYIEEKYGGEWEVNENFGMNQMPSFSETNVNQNAEDSFYNDWEEVIEPIVKPIEDILESCSSFAEFERKLIEAYWKDFSNVKCNKNRLARNF